MFRDIVGRKDLIEKLIAAAKVGRIPHAQLFWGPAGSQKLPLALAYAQYINCHHRLEASDGHDLGGLSSDACGKCPSCLKFQQLVHPDLHFIYPNNINGGTIKKDSRSLDYIGQWRELYQETQGEFSYQEWLEKTGIGSNRQALINIRDCFQILQCLSLKSSEADYRVIVIWLIEKLHTPIASTLLKTLEEPEPQTVFLLISENTDAILPTILSRLQLVKVPKVEAAAMEKFLLDSGCPGEEVRLLAQRSHGNLVEARMLLENNATRLTFHESFADWMRICFKADIPAIQAFAERMGSLGRESLKFFLEICLEEIQGCLLTGNHCTRWLNANNQEQTFWNNFSKYVSNRNVQRYYKLFDEAIYLTSRNAHVPTLLTDISLELCRILASAKKDLASQTTR